MRGSVAVRNRSRSVTMPAGRGSPPLDEECTDPPFGHDPGGFAQGPAGRYGPRGRAHHLVEPAQVEEAVDPGQRRQRRRIRQLSGHRMPARLRFAVHQVGAAGGERLRLAEGAHVRLPQSGDELGEDPGRGKTVAEGIVPLLDRHAVPVRERFEA